MTAHNIVRRAGTAEEAGLPLGRLRSCLKRPCLFIELASTRPGALNPIFVQHHETSEE